MLWLAFGPLPQAPPSLLDGRMNGLWLRHQWFEGKKSDMECLDLVGTLHSHRIRDLYFHVGPLDAHGHIPNWKADAWRRTLALLRASAPNIRAFAWLGGVTSWTYGVADDTVDLDDVHTRAVIINTSRALIDEGGFDGIQFDLEIIPNGHHGFLSLLDDTRTACKQITLSVAAPNLRPFWLPLPQLWSAGYYSEVGVRCDQVAVMSYDTGLFTRASYKRFLRWELGRLSELLPNTSILMGVPTYKEPTWSHWPSTECLQVALGGIALGVETLPASTGFQGIAVYSEWTTDPDEWDKIPR